MDLVVWTVLGAVVGLIAWIGLLGAARMGVVVCVGIGAAAAVVGGVAAHPILGDVAVVRVSLTAGGSYAVTAFGLAPFVVAGVVAVIAGQRLTARRPVSSGSDLLR